MNPEVLTVADMPGLNARAIAVLGAPGAGKTETLAAFFDAPMRVAAIDPAGQLGKILGKRSDVDVVTLPKDWEARAGSLFPALVKRLRAPMAKVCVIIPPTAYGTATAFVEQFAISLMEGNISELLFIMEEAQRYLGQNREGLSQMAMATVEMGRNWNWGRITATQRPSELHAGARGRSETLLLGRMDRPLDLKAYAEFLEPYIPDDAERWRMIYKFKDFPPGRFILVEPAHLPTVNQ